MSLLNLPSPLDSIFADTEDLPVFFERLTIAIVELLKCDRCYIYIRDPQFHNYQIPSCYCARSEVPNIAQPQISTESHLLKADPLFAAALNCKPTIFIEDTSEATTQCDRIATKSHDASFQLHFDKENSYSDRQNYLRHKAIVQAHICLENQLWGIIRASQFDRPRPWTKFDRSTISVVVDKITPLVSMYARKELRGTIQVAHDGFQ